jgi:hypothetical protein
MSAARASGLAALALTGASCADAVLTAPPGSSISVSANPLSIPATNGVSVISAMVVEPAGTLVPDGTVVLFFTSLGQIEPQGKTHAGVARVNLLSDGRSGTATVTVASGGPAVAASGGGGGNTAQSVQVKIGAVLPARVFVSAVPNRIVDSRTTHIFAQVFDDQGNPVANVPVIFSFDGSAPTEHLDSGGLPVFTDNNGVAEDVLRTQYPFTSPPKTVTVKATTSNGTSGTVVVNIN